MMSPSTHRFAHLFLLLLLGILLMGCKEEIVVQKQLGFLAAGDYRLTGIVSYTIDGAISTVPIMGTLSVYASESPNSFYFREKTNAYTIGYLTTRTGEAFTIENVLEETKYKSTTYYGRQNGEGKIGLNLLQIDRYANTNTVSLISPIGERISYTFPIRKHISLIATK
jgi:hypothetical protein